MLRPEAITQAHILVVDDQLANVALLEDLLDQAGYVNVRGITHPRQASAVFQEFGPDLVLLDLLMPGLDGFGVMAQLRPLIPEGGFLPVLVLTAEISPEVKRRALSEGATDFLAKPLDTVEVLLRIRNLLHTRALHLQVERENDVLEERVADRTRELEDARAQILELYQELGKRNQELHGLVERLMQTGDEERPRPAVGAHNHTDSATVERLTPREHDVLRLVAQGQTNAEVAKNLVVTVATVKTHIEHIIAKLGVADRTQAAVRAVELGLLSARALTTVLFTDIVRSTELAVEMGDRRWHDLKQRHHTLVRRELARFHGKEIDTAGDGFLATFDAPERAVRCAHAVRDAVRSLGLEVRAGLHTGEVERQGGGVSGIAVHVGARVVALAGPGDVLVSSVVRDLVAGSGLGFADRGAHRLKGVPGEWRLFAVEQVVTA
ncbi:MAG: response regulator [Chloroflexi bacterium]|nr:response regulator [Chloroflexota bacterium]